MRKVFIWLFSCLLISTPSISTVSCLTPEQKKVADFVNGYLLATLFFKLQNNNYNLVSNFSESSSQGKVYLENNNTIINNKSFMTMLEYANITSEKFVTQWNFLITFLATRLDLNASKDINKHQYYNFSNFFVVSKHSYLKIEQKNDFSVLSWDTYIYINNINQHYMAIFKSQGNFNFQIWTNNYL